MKTACSNPLDFINCKRSLLIASAACFCLKFLTWGQNRIDPAGRPVDRVASTQRMADFVPLFLGLRDRDFLPFSQGEMAKNRDIFPIADVVTSASFYVS